MLYLDLSKTTESDNGDVCTKIGSCGNGAQIGSAGDDTQIGSTAALADANNISDTVLPAHHKVDFSQFLLRQ